MRGPGAPRIVRAGLPDRGALLVAEGLPRGVTGRARPVRASRADARAGPGTGPPPGRSLTRTAPRPAHTPASPADPDRAARAGVPPPVPVQPGARPPGHAHQSGDVRPITGGLAERQPWRGAGWFPRVRRSRRTGRPAADRGRIRPTRPIERRAVSRGRGRSWASSAAAAATAWPGGRRVPVPAGLAWSRAAGRGFAGHGSASRPVCLLGWSSGARSARVGSGGVYAVSRSVAVRQACSTARSRTATRVSRAAIAWRLRRP